VKAAETGTLITVMSVESTTWRNTTMKKILNTFNYSTMEIVFNADFEWFSQFGPIVESENGQRHIFVDNGADILAVAHLDTVNDSKHFIRVEGLGEHQWTVFSNRCDDRLGAYLLIDVLPQFGLHYDILFCDDEEIGKSSAKNFVTEKQYKWVFEIDRRMDDVVTYGYSSIDWDNHLKKYFTVGRGSVSDISYLEHLGCKAFNVGAGYENEHDETYACFHPIITASQVGKLVQFYYDNRFQHFPHTKKVYAAAATTYKYWNTWDDAEDMRITHITPPAPVKEYKSPLKFPADAYLDADLYPDRIPTECKYCNVKFGAVVVRSDNYMGVCEICEPDIIECCYCTMPAGCLAYPEGDLLYAIESDIDMSRVFCEDCLKILEDKGVVIDVRDEDDNHVSEADG
jgi:hypothetical protein